jgi:Xaa-Pro aminopeptidase
VLGNDVDRFEAGMVIGVEAFLSKKGVGAAGFEQMFIVGEQENELLSPTPMLWW